MWLLMGKTSNRWGLESGVVVVMFGCSFMLLNGGGVVFLLSRECFLLVVPLCVLSM